MRLRITDVATVMGTALALWGVGLVLLLLGTARFQASYIRSSLSIDVHLKDEIPADSLEAFLKYLRQQDWTREAKFISKDQAKEDYLKMTGDDFSEIIEINPLPQSVRIFLKENYVDNAKMALIEKELEKKFGGYILEIIRKRELVQAINRNIYRLSLALGGFALVQLLVMLTLLSNSIRLAVYARRLTIKTMQLVGAHPAFIRRPFLSRALFTGLISGLLAAMALVLPALQAESLFPDVWAVVPPVMIAAIGGLLIVLGVLVNTLAAWQIVNRLLKTEMDNLY